MWKILLFLQSIILWNCYIQAISHFKMWSKLTIKSQILQLPKNLHWIWPKVFFAWQGRYAFQICKTKQRQKIIFKVKESNLRNKTNNLQTESFKLAKVENDLPNQIGPTRQSDFSISKVRSLSISNKVSFKMKWKSFRTDSRWLIITSFCFGCLAKLILILILILMICLFHFILGLERLLASLANASLVNLLQKCIWARLANWLH